MRLPNRFQTKREDQLFWNVDPILEKLIKVLLALLIGVLHLISFPVEAYLRTNQGSRFVRMLTIGPLFLFGVAFSFLETTISIFLIGASALSVFNLLRSSYREIFRPDMPWLHTRRIGIPWGGAYPGFWWVLSYIRLPRWPFLIHVIYEPVLCVFIGVAFFKFFPWLGIYLVSAGVALSLKMLVFFFTYLETLRNVNDQVVASKAISVRNGNSPRNEVAGEAIHAAAVAVPSWENVESANEEESASAGPDESEKESTPEKRVEPVGRYSCPKCSAPLAVARTDPSVQCQNCKSVIRVSPKRHVAVA
jgi:DNA-directed RNA polymerase subunit RPC12/RpoP